VSGDTGASRPVNWIPLNMLVKRTLVTLVLLPIGIAFIVLGGIYFSLLITFILALAAWEYTRLMRLGGLQPALFLVVAGAMLLALGRAWNGFESAPWIISLLILASMTYHLVAFERGRDQSATDMGVTLGGMLYIGWIGAYLISLRALPDGMWWVLLALPAVWIADSGAYFIGSRWGRHKMSPRLSPKKSWEGYFGGILFGTLGGALLGYIYPAWLGAGPTITPLRGLLLGLVMSILPTLGDLGESMIKRQVGVKDSGNLLPGHGGAFDRIDSWLWAGVISYYIIAWFF
jgi:phosphatidate cytidylyltransferase